MKNPLAAAYGVPCETVTVDDYAMPIHFGNTQAEYEQLRSGVVVSDQNHYGRFRISGSDALELLNLLNLPDVARLPIGKAMTSLMIDEDGGVVCDCYIIAMAEGYLLLTEGKTPAAVMDMLKDHAGSFDVKLEDVSDSLALIGLDGPFSWELLKELIGVRVLGLRYLELIEKQCLGSTRVHLLRAGKSGEFGYLILVSDDKAAEIWQLLLTAGKNYNIRPAGFEALTLCRLENRFPNVWEEGSKVANPLELNCRVMFDREKEEHLGRETLEQLMATGPQRRVIGFKITGSDTAPAVGASVTVEGKTVGSVVNSRYSFKLGQPIGLALLDADYAYVGINYSVETSSGTAEATTVSAPFVDNRSMTIRPQEDSYFA